MINGQECGYQVGEASVVDPESGWIYTLWLNTDLTFTPEATSTPDPQLTPEPADAAARGEARDQVRGQAGHDNRHDQDG